MKRCAKCKQYKRLECFGKNSRSSDGKHYYCKPCTNAQGKTYRQNNLEKDRLRSLLKARKYREEQPERAKAWSRKYYLANKEKMHKTWRDKYSSNMDFRRQKRATNKDWVKKNKDRVSSYIVSRIARFKAAGVFDEEKWQQRLDVLGRECYYCQGPYEQIDHTVALSRGGTNHIANLRPICKRCNNSKRNRRPSEWTDRIYERLWVEE